MGLLVTLTLLSSLPAQPAKALPGDKAIEQFLAADTAKVSKNVLAGATSLEEWREKRPGLRRQYLDMLGLWPLPAKTALKAKITGTLTRGDVVIENLHFQSKPGLYVTANLYRPKVTKNKLPAILYVCGHSGKGRDGNKTAFQDHGMWFARNGYVCLIVDTLQLGEIAGIHHGTYNRNRWWWHSRGYTPAGVECWNGIRGIDYLVSRPEVDADRIGVTGISGGGATTVWVAAADERVKVAVPVSGMSDLESYVSHKVINGHCDCMFLYNTYRWEWTTIAGLIAPRPMLFANSDNDSIFPMDGNRRIIARLRQAYRMHGKPDLVDDYVSKGGHDYRPDLRLAIFRWFDRHLMGVKREIKDADDKPLPGKQLRVFAEDADLPKDAINARIDETFVPVARPTLPAEKEFPAWKKALLGQLREKVFRTFPQRVALPETFEWEKRVDENRQSLAGRLYATEGYPRAFLSNVVQEGKGRGTLVILDEDDEPGMKVPDWARPHVGDGEVMLVRPRGTGPTRWTEKSSPNYVRRAHLLLGRTVDAGRVYDIAVLARLQGENNKHQPTWKLVGRGKGGVLAAYAALFEPKSISGVVVIDPPTSHRAGPHLLGVQRLLDIPDALGLLAPLPLVLVGAKDRAFETTAEIYRRAGAAGKLTRK